MACRNCTSNCFSTSISHERFSFFIVMEEHFSTLLEIPEKVARRMRLRTCKYAILQAPTGYLWHVNLCCSDVSASFTDGWQSFVFENSVTSKDILLFSCVNHTYFVVHVFGANGCEKQSSSGLQSYALCSNCIEQGMPPKVCNHENCGQRKIPTKPSAAVPISYVEPTSDEDPVVTNCFTDLTEEKPLLKYDIISEMSMEPQFEVILTKSAVFGRPCRLGIPANFAKLWLPKGNLQIILLHDKKAGKWAVSVRKHDKSMKLSGGWKRFVVSNELHKDEICVFKLINRIHLIFMVHVRSHFHGSFIKYM